MLSLAAGRSVFGRSASDCCQLFVQVVWSSRTTTAAEISSPRQRGWMVVPWFFPIHPQARGLGSSRFGSFREGDRLARQMIGYFLHLTRACPRPVPPARRRPAPCNAVAESVLSLLSIFWRCCPSSALLSGLGIGSQDTIALGRYIDERHLLGEGPPGNQRFVERKPAEKDLFGCTVKKTWVLSEY